MGRVNVYIFKTSGHLSLWLLGECHLLFQDTKSLVLCGKSEVPDTQGYVRCFLKCFCLAWFGWPTKIDLDDLFWPNHVECAEGDVHGQ